ncbi:Cyclic GMP-AMP synthase [Amphibalanus amphitrite]|uniref:Cyclic GMP-AMP synthase n=1 Tax=Amphibalanus amphitrite TaxID=1232801 RepID=A0A6A4VQC1_AMPAM|nr:protein mab-21-like 2 [Amphibalanus amphitrite]KAF0298407.1 Cyclic GMP-AMP synthase [Amphibalanus amphitrite]
MGNLLSRAVGIASLQPAFEAPLTDEEVFSALARVFRWREQLLAIGGEQHAAFQYQQLLAAELGSSLQTDWAWQMNEPRMTCSPADGCSDQGPGALHLERSYLSGSSREGTEVHIHEVREISDLSLEEALYTKNREEKSYTEQSSDIDIMFELAPVSVYSEEDPPPAHAPPGVVVVQESAGRPGYVLLRHHHSRSCRRPNRNFLSGYTVRKRMELFGNALQDAAKRLGIRVTNFEVGGGPASCIAVDDENNSRIDLVPCVPCRCWPSEQYRRRRRPSGYPDAALVASLCAAPAFLVVAGSQRLDKDAWRLSFSRHETILLRSLSHEQRICLTLLKHCNVMLGHRFSSYHLKTALMWVCEQRPRELWTWDRMHESMTAVVDYLLEKVSRSDLQCYFWPEISLMAGYGMDVQRDDVLNLKHGMALAARYMLACLLDSSAGDLFQKLLGHHMNGEKFYRHYYRDTLRQGLNGFSMLSSSSRPGIDASLWSDNFLRVFQWENLPNRCRKSSWFAEHGLGTDSSEEGQQPEDGW